MPHTVEHIASSYPLPVYNFRVDLEGGTMSVTQVTGIALERDHLVYRHGLSFAQGEAIRTYRLERYVPVTLHKAVVRGTTALYDWLHGDGTERRTMDVHLCNAEGEPAVTWRIAKAVALKLNAPGFDPTANDVAIESLEILAAGISIEHH